jgi:HAD superfamily hydrolase (TIGR01509 family)
VSRELRALLLDFDGTVAETERYGHRVAYNQAFAEMKLDWRWDEELYGSLLSVTGGKERLRHYLERYRPELLDNVVSSGLVEKIHEAKVRHFARLAATIPLRPGVLRLVREARAASAAIAITTTASELGVRALLVQHQELPTMVDLIAGSEAVERKKPAPDVYIWALDRLGLAAGNCVAIEDSNAGFRAALAAGLTTLVTVSDYTAEDDFAGASAVVSNLGEVNAPACSLSGPKPPNGIVDLAFLQALLNSAGESDTGRGYRPCVRQACSSE